MNLTFTLAFITLILLDRDLQSSPLLVTLARDVTEYTMKIIDTHVSYDLQFLWSDRLFDVHKRLTVFGRWWRSDASLYLDSKNKIVFCMFFLMLLFTLQHIHYNFNN